jgi:hypothetical protein
VTTGEFELSPIAITVYVIIVLILAWPLIFRAVCRILPAKAVAVVEAVSEEPALAVAEHHYVETSDAGLSEAARPPSDKET